MSNDVGAAREVVVVGVPIDCIGAHGTRDAFFGTELAPAALRHAGLLSTLEAVLPLRKPSHLADPAMAGRILTAAERPQRVVRSSCRSKRCHRAAADRGVVPRAHESLRLSRPINTLKIEVRNFCLTHGRLGQVVRLAQAPDVP